MVSFFTGGCRGTAVTRGALGVATLALASSVSLAPAVQAQQCTYYRNYDSYRFTGAEASAPGFSCQVGDKTFTNFAGQSRHLDPDHHPDAHSPGAWPPAPPGRRSRLWLFPQAAPSHRGPFVS